MPAPEVPNSDLDAWLSVLKPYQRNVIKEFLREVPPEQAAERWLGTAGSPNIVPFGGSRDTKPFWDKFKSEFRRFLCDDGAYVEEKAALCAEGGVSKALLISAISAAIGASIGYAATLLAPAVAIMLCTAGKIGVNAYCGIAEDG